MIIKRAGRSDIPVLLKYMMDLQKFEHRLSERVRADDKTRSLFEKHFLKKRIGDPDYIFLVAWENDKPLGIISGWKENVSHAYKNEYVGYICQLIVDPQYRTKNIGKELVDQIIFEFKKIGIKELKTEVLCNNVKGIEFWKKLGFEDLYRQMRKDI